MSIIEINCPSCNGLLKIDTESKTVLEHKKIIEEKKGLNDFLESQKTRKSDLESLFNKGSEESKKRKAALEEDFKKAKDNPDEIEGDYENPFQWD